GLRSLVRAGQRLLEVLRREDAECDRHARFERGQLQAGRGLAGDVLEVRRLAPDDAAERDDGDVPARLRERHGAERQLECTRHRHDGDVLPVDPRVRELGHGRVEQPVRDLAVEAREDDRDPLLRPLRRAGDEVDADGDVEPARRVSRELLGDRLRHRRLDDELLLAGVLLSGRLGLDDLLARPMLVALLVHASSSNRRPWWCRPWPSLSRLAARYLRFSGCGGISIGTCSVTSSPKACKPDTFFGLFVSSRMVVSPSSLRIWLPIPHSRSSAPKPSARFASTVSSPPSCSSYAFNLFSRPMPRPSCAMYRSTPRGSSAMSFIAASSCSPQSQRREWNTSPVRHSEWTRTSTSSAPSTSPCTSATCCFPVSVSRKRTASNSPYAVGSCTV